MSTNKSKETFETKEVLDKLNHTALKGELFFQKHYKTFGVIVLAIILAIIGYFIYKSLVIDAKNEKASVAFMRAEGAYNMGKQQNNEELIKEALNGKGLGALGFAQISKEYSATAYGKASALYAGVIKYDEGKYQEALQLFKSFKSGDDDLMAKKYGAIGDTYVQLDNVKEGLSNMEKAISASDTPFTKYQFARKASVLAEDMKDYKKAVSYYQDFAKFVSDKKFDMNELNYVETEIERLSYLAEN